MRVQIKASTRNHAFSFWLTLAVLLIFGHQAAGQSFVKAQDTKIAAQWLSSALAHGGTLPFSFDYAGKPSSGFLSTWTHQRITTKLDPQRTRLEDVYIDPATKLTIRCEAVRYSDYPALEWTVYLQNKGIADTPIIANVQGLDLNLNSIKSGDWTLHYNEGSHASASDYQPLTTELTPRKDLPLGGASGWSTTEILSYFNVVGPDNNLLIGIGWPGNWKSRFTRDSGSGLHIMAGQGQTRFVLHPSEEARSPLIALQFYTGDWIHGQNLWRRWMMAHCMPHPNGKLPTAILEVAAPDVGGPGYHEAVELHAQDGFIKKRHMPCDIWLMDAGWYLDGGNWWNVGTWTEDKAMFPDGIRAVSDHARSLGMKQILWFEPERVTPGSEIASDYPEFVLGGKGGGLFNMGDPVARKFITDLISSRITEYGVDLYRQDYNIDPLGFWRGIDAPDRQGLTENHYVTGFLAFWDALLARHPGMLIDCCASGGRRNDLEVLRRAVPLLQSDYRDEQGTQGNNYGAALWMPFHGDGGPDRYRSDMAYQFRTYMAPCHGYGPDADDDTYNWPLLQTLANQEKQISPYYFGDYYPLTPWTLNNGAWMAWQYDRPDLASGIVMAFRRPDSGELSRTFRLSGLEPKATYRVHDFDTNLDTLHTGVDLMQTGLTVTLPEKPQSALLMYRKMERK